MNYMLVVLPLIFCISMALCRFSGELDKLKPIEFEDSEEHHTEVHSSSKRSGKEILGTATWTFLHRFAGMYPANPDEKYQECVRLFLNTLPHIYPCEECAVGMRAFFDCHPPEVPFHFRFHTDYCFVYLFISIFLCHGYIFTYVLTTILIFRLSLWKNLGLGFVKYIIWSMKSLGSPNMIVPIGWTSGAQRIALVVT